MPVFLTIQLMAGVALMTLAFLHLVVASPNAARRNHALLALTALLAAAEAFCAYWQYARRLRRRSQSRQSSPTLFMSSLDRPWCGFWLAMSIYGRHGFLKLSLHVVQLSYYCT